MSRPERGWWVDALTRVMHEQHGPRVSVVSVDDNVYESRRRSLSIAFDLDGEVARLFCKIGPIVSRDFVGRLDGVGYESTVYSEVLCRVAHGCPRLRGIVDDGEEICLAIEHLPDALRVGKAPQPESLRLAVETLAAVHDRCAPLLAAQCGHAALNRFDALRGRDWLARAFELHGASMLSTEVGGSLGALFDELTSGPATLVHGDCYPSNVLVSGGKPVFIDWETAGVGPGEIDLAAITEGWSDAVVADCVSRYCRVRDVSDEQAAVARRVDLARCLMYVRALSGGPSMTRDSARLDAIRRLEALVPRLVESAAASRAPSESG